MDEGKFKFVEVAGGKQISTREKDNLKPEVKATKRAQSGTTWLPVMLYGHRFHDKRTTSCGSSTVRIPSLCRITKAT